MTVKEPKKDRQTKGNSPALDAVINMAKTTQSDQPVKAGAKTGRKTTKGPAIGYKRTTVDIPEVLHRAVATEALATNRDRREILEEVLERRYKSPEFKKYKT